MTSTHRAEKSRRLVAPGVPSAAVAIARGKTSDARRDPIFALIEAHRRAERRFNDALTRKSRAEDRLRRLTGSFSDEQPHYEEIVGPHNKEEEQTCAAYGAALEELFAGTATTPAGLAALFAYARATDKKGREIFCEENLYGFLEAAERSFLKLAGLAPQA